MPWDFPQEPQSHTYRPQPTPPPNYTVRAAPVAPSSPERMRPDALPAVVATNPQTGERVRVDIGDQLRSAIQQAVNQSVQDSKGAMEAKANRAVARIVKADEEHDESIESSFQGGPATTRTFIQGAALDIGAAVFAALATVIGPDSDLFDKELWAIVGVMMVKTLVSTALSYALRFKA